ncbi:MAG: metallophosphoesterase [Moraxella sp.]|uniref:metallophosphoesterase n=1 Tax=Moraxella sp. TaxID=479 RepID=UPI0026DCC70E|nr:metallophosphoesterase [Moraxella sp.]MDO4450930.1 metallophosphoesterase [Moraxella sp.]
MNYPTHLSAPSDFIIAQISDLHLSKHDEHSFDKFLSVLDLALNHKPNLLLLTGDLVNDGVGEIYDWLFDVLKNTNIPFLCLAGNHDVTHEIGHDLPFDERQFLPIPADERLIDTHRLIIELPHVCWQLLAVNSAVGGQIYGQISEQGLAFLQTHLNNNHPTLIALHHHPTPVGSAWIDEYKLCNGDEFWQMPCHTPTHVLCGHVHQAHALPHAHGVLYTCPATSRQFTPHQDKFGIDTLASGFRLVRLHDNGKLDTQIYRLMS